MASNFLNERDEGMNQVLPVGKQRVVSRIQTHSEI